MVGLTVCNDVSFRTIEGENPLDRADDPCDG